MLVVFVLAVVLRGNHLTAIVITAFWANMVLKNKIAAI